MHRDTLLTQDELDFIQMMQHNPQLNLRDASSSLTVNGGAQIRDLLTRLAAHDQLTIQAQFDNQQLTFPLHLVEDEFHALHLRLGVPTIFEDGPMIRPWRLALETPVALENIRGNLSALWVHEVSFKGVLVEIRGRIKPPKTFSLWFSPSGYERIALRGTLERETARGLFAYRLDQSDVSETERLRQFILHQHRLIHPEVHA
ncbi:hypothetical protein NTD80_05125 [Pseudomonas sp. 13B_2.1_Bac1]|jgi:hypothetical protein|uniref:PilZ domain-containing protein n=1 Tax=Pseudomonas aylmerensis TaxID=1869229 RepID=A0A2T4G941_9PSED|nr:MULTISPECIES: hypothetical protein [Pseudomonas]AYF50845.1 hypothetical protein DXV65_25880 [Pseudomonas fluorescens]MBK5479260.1 hypothetical protein [Pseudomonas sp. TH21]MBS7844652.1 hypothetical protein [Pseudomonas fluorescens]MCU1782130.1 hypothetical protein [Pseudomonas sp. 13B_2.1_Bac1]OCW19267.1 hypothetical protein BBG20_25825 [Pseudomonas aylmerensis]